MDEVSLTVLKNIIKTDVTVNKQATIEKITDLQLGQTGDVAQAVVHYMPDAIANQVTMSIENGCVAFCIKEGALDEAGIAKRAKVFCDTCVEKSTATYDVLIDPATVATAVDLARIEIASQDRIPWVAGVYDNGGFFRVLKNGSTYTFIVQVAANPATVWLGDQLRQGKVLYEGKRATFEQLYASPLYSAIADLAVRNTLRLMDEFLTAIYIQHPTTSDERAAVDAHLPPLQLAAELPHSEKAALVGKAVRRIAYTKPPMAKGAVTRMFNTFARTADSIAFCFSVYVPSSNPTYYTIGADGEHYFVIADTQSYVAPNFDGSGMNVITPGARASRSKLIATCSYHEKH